MRGLRVGTVMLWGIGFALAGHAFAGEMHVDRAERAAQHAPAPGVPLDEATQRLAGWHVVAATPWPGAYGFDDVIGVVGVVPGAGAVRVITWVRRGETQGNPERNVPAGGGEVGNAGLFAADVAGDGRAALVALSTGLMSSQPQVFVADARPPHVLPDARLTAAIEGARDESEVRARIPLSRGLTPADVGSTSTRSLAARMTFATAAQIRDLVAPAGLSVCDLRVDRRDHRRQRCRPLTVSSLTDDVLTNELLTPLRAAFGPTAVGISCDAESGEHCAAQLSDGEFLDVNFDGSGPARRLRRVTHRHEAGG